MYKASTCTPFVTVSYVVLRFTEEFLILKMILKEAKKFILNITFLLLYTNHAKGKYTIIMNNNNNKTYRNTNSI